MLGCWLVCWWFDGWLGWLLAWQVGCQPACCVVWWVVGWVGSLIGCWFGGLKAWKAARNRARHTTLKRETRTNFLKVGKFQGFFGPPTVNIVPSYIFLICLLTVHLACYLINISMRR